MAGRGEANVTLGIPRLREILMVGALFCASDLVLAVAHSAQQWPQPACAKPLWWAALAQLAVSGSPQAAAASTQAPATPLPPRPLWPDHRPCRIFASVQLLQTAAASIKTPVMTLPLHPGLGAEAAAELAVRLKRIRLAEALKSERALLAAGLFSCHLLSLSKPMAAPVWPALHIPTMAPFSSAMSSFPSFRTIVPARLPTCRHVCGRERHCPHVSHGVWPRPHLHRAHAGADSCLPFLLLCAALLAAATAVLRRHWVPPRCLAAAAVAWLGGCVPCAPQRSSLVDLHPAIAPQSCGRLQCASSVLLTAAVQPFATHPASPPCSSTPLSCTLRSLG